MNTVTVALPAHLRALARVGAEVQVDVAGEVTIASVLDSLEARYPMLRGTIREHQSRNRRAYMRYFACGEDVSFEPVSTPLPRDVATGAEPFIVLGAIAGG